MRYALGMTDSSSPCTHARYGSTDFTRRDVVDNKTWCGWHTSARLSSPRLAFNEDSELVRRRKMANILDAMELAPPDDGHDSRACNRPEPSGRSASPCCMRYLTAVHEARSMTTQLADYLRCQSRLASQHPSAHERSKRTVPLHGAWSRTLVVL